MKKSKRKTKKELSAKHIRAREIYEIFENQHDSLIMLGQQVQRLNELMVGVAQVLGRIEMALKQNPPNDRMVRMRSVVAQAIAKRGAKAKPAK